MIFAHYTNSNRETSILDFYDAVSDTLRTEYITFAAGRYEHSYCECMEKYVCVPLERHLSLPNEETTSQGKPGPPLLYSHLQKR